MSFGTPEQVEMYHNMKIALDYSPKYLTTQSPWHGLIPLGHWLTLMIKPRVICELGSYRGDSFFTFYEASKDADMSKIVAVDTWCGDQNTGSYGEGPFRQFCTELERLNDSRIEFARMKFDEYVENVPDASIDLLHIDGAHDYGSVRNDFEKWKPKFSKKGVVFFHDIDVHERGFGVHKVWGELNNKYPGRCLSANYSNGLGALFYGEQSPSWLLAEGNSYSLSLILSALESAGQNIINKVRCEYDFIESSAGSVPADWLFNKYFPDKFIREVCSISNLSSTCQFYGNTNADLAQIIAELLDDRFADKIYMDSFKNDVFELLKSKFLELMDNRFSDEVYKENFKNDIFELLKDKFSELVDSKLS